MLIYGTDGYNTITMTEYIFLRIVDFHGVSSVYTLDINVIGEKKVHSYLASMSIKTYQVLNATDMT